MSGARWAILAVLVLLTALAGGIYLKSREVSTSIERIRVERVSLENATLSMTWNITEELRIRPLIREVGFDIQVVLNSSLMDSLRLKRLEYSLSILGEEVTNGTLEDVEIRPGLNILIIHPEPNEKLKEVLASAIELGLYEGMIGRIPVTYEFVGRLEVRPTAFGIPLGDSVRGEVRREGRFLFIYKAPPLPDIGQVPFPAIPTELGSLQVEDYAWVSNGTRIFKVFPSTKVMAGVQIRAREDLKGTFRLEIWLQRSSGEDKLVASTERKLELRKGDAEILGVSFVATADENALAYYMRLLKDGEVVWTMPERVPPRLPLATKD